MCFKTSHIELYNNQSQFYQQFQKIGAFEKENTGTNYKTDIEGNIMLSKSRNGCMLATATSVTSSSCL